MLEEEFKISRWIASDLRGHLSEAEKLELAAWIAAAETNQSLFEELGNEQHVADELAYFSSADKKAIWNKLLQGIAEEKAGHRKLPTKLWARITIAAIVLVVFGLGLFYWSNLTRSDSAIQYTEDIASGSTGATLTLANGKKIKLKNAGNGVLASEPGVVISKKANGQLVYEVLKPAGTNQINTLSTGRGETYSLTLPDRSKVWLNAASSLTYTVDLLENGTRRVKLTGEAYFEVARDKKHPFIVESQGQQIEVLGTHFNVSSYADDPAAKTTLLEGSVKVTSLSAKNVAHNPGLKTEILKPNQQAIFTTAGIRVINVSAESFVDWKDGAFSFEDERLQAIMKKISRWYDVDVIYNGTENDQQTFSGSVSRSASVSKVLEILTDISDLKFKIEGRKIFVGR